MLMYGGVCLCVEVCINVWSVCVLMCGGECAYVWRCVLMHGGVCAFVWRSVCLCVEVCVLMCGGVCAYV